MNRNPIRCTALITAAAICLAGCSFSGLDASNKFSCKAPDGVACASMSGVYANLRANNLPGQQISHGASLATTTKTPAPGSAVLSRPLFSGSPIRSAPRELRLWFAPWEDADGDLYDQSYAYLVIDNGQWLIAHNQRRIRDLYRPAPGIAVRDGAGAPAAVLPPAAPAAVATVPALDSGVPAPTGGLSGMADEAMRQAAMAGDSLKQFAAGVRMPDASTVGR
ncbi:type IV conjugative transfer system lipoprotein TraV [Burkholderia cenocepacia]|uniref:type IV conjugative transfer system lipoprotein TraV n=1 Tax=Burkholderia cenocepacia TaxID=95486 RepID=UPI0024B677E5|nr:type IV conjugative transfer system lipoprotein TraV [Burkholderia cenocepacia]MDI9695375.1 type IV conjugative transfer system lipoprotein TraV [Burkholderia cenocepacia]